MQQTTGLQLLTFHLLQFACRTAGQDDADPDLQSHIDPSLFNAAYQKPVYADSFLGDGHGLLNTDSLCDPVHPNNGCQPTDAVDGFAGNSHRWISSDVSPHHWLAIDLERLEWVQSISIFAGRDAPGDGQYHPVSGLCSYAIWAWAGDSSATLSPVLAAADDGWIEIDRQATETTVRTRNLSWDLSLLFLPSETSWVCVLARAGGNA